jgi:DNA-binding transcriptional LysR family regulator
MDIKSAELFILIAETGSLAGAARASNISPSLVSRVVAKLEDELRSPLLSRTTRRLELTEAGLRFLQWAQGVVAERERLLHDISMLQQEPAGPVRLGIDPLVGAFYLPELIRRFSAEHPRITIHIAAAEAPASLLDGRVDLAIHAGPLPSEDLYGQRAYEYRRILVAAPSYIEAYGAPRTPEDLRGHRCLTHRAPHSCTWAFRDTAGCETSVSIDPYVETDSWFLLRSLVLRGLGIMRMGAPLAEADVRNGFVVPLLEDYEVRNSEGNALGLWIVRSSRTRPLRVKLFTHFAIEHLRESVTVKELECEIADAS